ncbi:MAG: formate dehydrogenase accessory sulfurtransferase FdhD [Candidatus Eremiobacteraeota bacterium]|nr:formate dehydrogenase accessory sulfurtransferase FdhD [Candidatus Eremiobacteraeota bacterium]
MRPGPKSEARIVTVEDGSARSRFDEIATEEPLEIRLVLAGESRTVAITMRTPGNDFELVAGFLHNEGVAANRTEIRNLSYCVDRDVDEEQRYNIVNVELARSAWPQIERLERHFLTTSACGVCGKASIDQLKLRAIEPLGDGPALDPAIVTALPDRLRAAQGVFASTGGLHAAALFAKDGSLLALREDVGRHNAVDKLVGWALMGDKLPLRERILMVSGRTSFEIVQKALVAGIAAVCAVSAPSSLAVAVAREFGMTLIGFVRGPSFNVYAGENRLAGETPASR